MLFINPHQPWFGSGQFWEGHVKSDEGWNFSGSSFFGGPFPTMGHNEYLGWAHTVNEPDVADLYRVTFDDETNPLKYRYGEGYRTAEEWQDTIRVRTDEGVEDRVYTFRKTHYGPIVEKLDDQQYVAARIAQLFEGSRYRQALAMTKARSLEQWQEAMSQLRLQMFNTVYADREGNIFYLYNGAVPRRRVGPDWTKPVDGSDPENEWKGLHPFEELPQVLNPPSATCRIATPRHLRRPTMVTRSTRTFRPTWSKRNTTTSGGPKSRGFCCATPATSPSTIGSVWRSIRPSTGH